MTSSSTPTNLTLASKVTLAEVLRMKQAGEKIVVLTAYDFSFAALANRAGVDVLLVGDSLGNVIQGKKSTLPVTMEDMVYHTRCVANQSTMQSMVVADMPFGSYQESKEQALRNAVSLMAAGAEMVKIEGGAMMAETVHFLVERGIPVCAHIGLTPQSVHSLAGYKVQGRSEAQANRMKNDALALEQAGAAMMVLEMVPYHLAQEITKTLTVCATIGIGAGLYTDGQVLVIYDMLGIYPHKKARFVKNFMLGQTSIDGAVEAYVQAVKTQAFPTLEHSYE